LKKLEILDAEADFSKLNKRYHSYTSKRLKNIASSEKNVQKRFLRLPLK